MKIQEHKSLWQLTIMLFGGHGKSARLNCRVDVMPSPGLPTIDDSSPGLRASIVDAIPAPDLIPQSLVAVRLYIFR